MIGGLAAVLTGVVGSMARELAVQVALMFTKRLGDLLLDATYFVLFVGVLIGLLISVTSVGESILTELKRTTGPSESCTPTATGGIDIIFVVSVLIGGIIGVIISIILFSGLGWLGGWLFNLAFSRTSAPATGALVGG